MLDEKDIKLIERMIAESIAAITNGNSPKETYDLNTNTFEGEKTADLREDSVSRIESYGKLLGAKKKEKRKAKVIFAMSGGSATKGSQTTRITLPITWVREMGITPEERGVDISFKDGKIIIEKAKNTMDEIEN